MRVVLVWLCGCSSIFGLEDPQLRDAAIADARRDAPVDVALGTWGNISIAVQASADVDDPSLTDDMLEMYLDLGGDIAVTKRNSVTQSWPAPIEVVELSSGSLETTPEVSGDGLTILFSSDRVGSMSTDLWISTRQSRSLQWGIPTRFAEVSSAAADIAGSITPVQVVLATTRDGAAYELYWTNRASTAVPWPTPVALTDVNSGGDDVNPFIVRDGSAIYFDSPRIAASGTDLYVSKLSGGKWQPPTRIDELATPMTESDPWVSPDGRTIYFASDRDGLRQIYVARR